MFDDKECQSCIGVQYYCSIPMKLERRSCPCLNCLLKSICKESCVEYDTYLKISETIVKSRMVKSVNVYCTISDYKTFLIDINLVKKEEGL
ncbi:MAG: hypothetical protein ACFFG0_03820 [Candidatus Thorarchaeota archaeon]